MRLEINGWSLNHNKLLIHKTCKSNDAKSSTIYMRTNTHLITQSHHEQSFKNVVIHIHLTQEA